MVVHFPVDNVFRIVSTARPRGDGDFPIWSPATDIAQVFEHVVAWLIQRGFRLSTSCQRGVTDVRIWWDNNRCSVDVQRIGEASHEIMARQICEAALKAWEAMEDNDGKEGV